MKLEELKLEIQKYQYIEDTNIIDIALASIISNRLKLGDPIWLVIIGASSGGKSQILRPLAMTDTKFMHRVDDLTENTFLSGMKTQEGDMSLLSRIGERGMIVISDLTVIFSKSPETRATILSQFRMIYDGEMIKFSGNMKNPLVWKGYLGILAGSTPSIYSKFEEVSDMGERFIYYRMKDYDAKKATKLALGRKIFGKELDNILSVMYEEYMKEVISQASIENIAISEMVNDRIIEVAILSERIRTTIQMDWKGENINKVPTPAMPMRVALQLMAIARGLYVMRGRELNENDLSILDWCAYSLANEEKRACLEVLAGIPFNTACSTSQVADEIGLSTAVIGNILQSLSAVGILERTGGTNGLLWRIENESDHITIRRINKTTKDIFFKDRQVTREEVEESNAVQEHAFESF